MSSTRIPMTPALRLWSLCSTRRRDRGSEQGVRASPRSARRCGRVCGPRFAARGPRRQEAWRRPPSLVRRRSADHRHCGHAGNRRRPHVGAVDRSEGHAAAAGRRGADGERERDAGGARRLPGRGKTTGSDGKGERTYDELGTIGGYRVVHAQCEMGGLAALERAHQTIADWHPDVVLAVGVAFGVDRKRQAYGDVLVASQVTGYERQRVNEESRGDLARATSRRSRALASARPPRDRARTAHRRALAYCSRRASCSPDRS